MPAGYSGSPLLKKLGIKEEMKVQLIGEPKGYYELVEKDISSQTLPKKRYT
ncbi:MAG: hypothetical protein JWO92_1780 [Chitinophagaceae bacterium]|nr:hypothetical protein [Chitinophagaceae bacterium]